jgi:hypothetical protein
MFVDVDILYSFFLVEIWNLQTLLSKNIELQEYLCLIIPFNWMSSEAVRHLNSFFYITVKVLILRE